MLISVKEQEEIPNLAGKVHWQGDWTKVGRVAECGDPSIPRFDTERHVTGPVSRLRALIPAIPLLVGDLILCEILQGLRSEREARLVERGLRRFETVSLLDPDLAV